MLVYIFVIKVFHQSLQVFSLSGRKCSQIPNGTLEGKNGNFLFKIIRMTWENVKKQPANF